MMVTLIKKKFLWLIKTRFLALTEGIMLFIMHSSLIKGDGLFYS